MDTARVSDGFPTTSKSEMQTVCGFFPSMGQEGTSALRKKTSLPHPSEARVSPLLPSLTTLSTYLYLCICFSFSLLLFLPYQRNFIFDNKNFNLYKKNLKKWTAIFSPPYPLTRMPILVATLHVSRAVRRLLH